MHTFSLLCPNCGYLLYSDTILEGAITLPDDTAPASCSLCGWSGEIRDLQTQTSSAAHPIGELDYQI
jgi:hypothetical protein